jgi:hypothetical protein
MLTEIYLCVTPVLITKLRMEIARTGRRQNTAVERLLLPGDRGGAAGARAADAHAAQRGAGRDHLHRLQVDREATLGGGE